MMPSCSITGQKQWNRKSEFAFCLLLDLVLFQTAALFGTLEPQFVNVRLTDGQVGELGEVGHTAEKQDSCKRTKIFSPHPSVVRLFLRLFADQNPETVSVCLCTCFFLSCFNLLKKMLHFSKSSLGSSSVVIHCRNLGGALLGGL